MLTALKRDLAAKADKEKAAFFPRFFKAGKGEYAEGDVFIGVTVPDVRMIAKAYRDLPLTDIEALLADKIHERRLAALEILVMRFERGDDAAREEAVRFYLFHLDRVNNWDLVDGSAPYLLGEWLADGNGDEALLDTMARSTHLWTQRVAIVSTYAFIKRGTLQPTFRIATILLRHPHDLIHKAVGWMLREAGKKDRSALETFLDKHAATMPRTMLRYALEKFEPAARVWYMGMGKARR
jgi:3-methyladenine DNA glycosylase AlkD